MKRNYSKEKINEVCRLLAVSSKGIPVYQAALTKPLLSCHI